MQTGLPVMVSVFMAISAVISLVTIISIYREGGILKRLRATPLRPYTILSAHVLAKLLFTAVTLAMLIARRSAFLPGRPAGAGDQLCLCAVAEHAVRSCRSDSSSRASCARHVSRSRSARSCSIPMLGLSGLFVPVEALPSGCAVGREAVADDLCRVAVERNLDRRVLVRASGRSCGPGDVRRDLCRAVGQGVSVGIRAG